jgi:hypothetical protein
VALKKVSSRRDRRQRERKARVDKKGGIRAKSVFGDVSKRPETRERERERFC